jgi:hypothetical protein
MVMDVLHNVGLNLSSHVQVNLHFVFIMDLLFVEIKEYKQVNNVMMET